MESKEDWKTGGRINRNFKTGRINGNFVDKGERSIREEKLDNNWREEGDC